MAFFFPETWGPLELWNVDCGMRIEKETPKSEIGNSKSEMGGPMLFG
jgi:hypothetical protein